MSRHGDTDSPAGAAIDDARPDLATMLAEMDDRLQSLQRELESVTASAARQPSEGWRPPPPTVAPAPPPIPPAIARSAHVSRISGSRTTIPESGAPDDSPVRALAPKAAGASAVTLPAARKRRPPAAGRTQTAPDDDAPPRERVAAGAEAVASQTILEAEQEARSVVDEALRRVTEIGVRTRALLEQPGTAPEPAAARTPPRSRGRARTPATRTAPAARSGRASATAPDEPLTQEGKVTLEAGPFAHVAQLKDFEAALASIAGVEDVYIATFERSYAHFLLRVAEPTPIVTELRTRVPDALRVIDAGNRDVRLEIVGAQPVQSPGP